MHTHIFVCIYILYTQCAVRGVACIQDVGCTHPGFAPYLARIRCPKVRCVHPSKWHLWLRESVPKKTLTCICFRNDPCVDTFSEKTQHMDTNIRNLGFYYRVLKAIGFHYSTLVYEGVYNRPEQFLMQPQP